MSTSCCCPPGLRNDYREFCGIGGTAAPTTGPITTPAPTVAPTVAPGKSTAPPVVLVRGYGLGLPL